MKNILIAVVLLFSCSLSFANIHEDLSDYMISSTRMSDPDFWIPRCQKETGYPEFECTAAYAYYTNERGRERLRVLGELNNAISNYLKYSNK